MGFMEDAVTVFSELMLAASVGEQSKVAERIQKRDNILN